MPESIISDNGRVQRSHDLNSRGTQDGGQRAVVILTD